MTDALLTTLFANQLERGKFYLSNKDKNSQKPNLLNPPDAIRDDVALWIVSNKRIYPNSYAQSYAFLVYDIYMRQQNDIPTEDKQDVKDEEESE